MEAYYLLVLKEFKPIGQVRNEDISQELFL